jgi:hypothetical protein
MASIPKRGMTRKRPRFGTEGESSISTIRSRPFAASLDNFRSRPFVDPADNRPEGHPALLIEKMSFFYYSLNDTGKQGVI